MQFQKKWFYISINNSFASDSLLTSLDSLWIASVCLSPSILFLSSCSLRSNSFSLSSNSLLLHSNQLLLFLQASYFFCIFLNNEYFKWNWLIIIMTSRMDSWWNIVTKQTNPNPLPPNCGKSSGLGIHLRRREPQ